MTSQTKHFIELRDIVGLRLECRNKKCDASLLVGLNNEDGNLSSLLAANNNVLGNCPACGRAWMGEGLATFESDVKKFLRLMHDVKKLDEKLGCSMTFEITPETFETKTEIKPS
jgi:hypothetical protein